MAREKKRWGCGSLFVGGSLLLIVLMIIGGLSDNEKPQQRNEARVPDEPAGIQAKADGGAAPEEPRPAQAQDRHEQKAEPVQVSSVTWKEIDRIYNVSSEFTDLQKDEYWKHYEGKRVRWAGTITDISEGLLGGLSLQIKMRPETFTFDLQIHMKKSERSKILQVHKGDVIAFEGTLDSWGSLLPITLKDGELFDPGEARRKEAERLRLVEENAAKEEAARLKAIEDAKTPEQKAAEAAAKREEKASGKLRLAKQLLKKNKSSGKKWLQEVVDDYPGTEAAKEASELLEGM